MQKSKAIVGSGKEPVLVDATRSKKIVDMLKRRRHRGIPLDCRYCNKVIQSRYALSKGSRTGTKYYHIECAIKAGFDIKVSEMLEKGQ